MPVGRGTLLMGHMVLLLSSNMWGRSQGASKWVYKGGGHRVMGVSYHVTHR